MATGVQITGLRQRVRELERLGIAVGDLKEAFGAIASKAAEIASGFAPSLTGTLRASIRGSKAKNRAIVTAGRASVPYAGAINYGWQARNIEPAMFMQQADAEISPMSEQELERSLDRLIAQNGG